MMALRETEGQAYIAKLAESAKCTYAHAFKVVGRLEALGLVKSGEQGRVRVVRLTDLGKALTDELSRLLCLMELVEVSTALDELYDSEVRGKLREEIDREKVLRKADEYGARIEETAKKLPQELQGLVRREIRRLEELKAEVKGLVVGSPAG